MLKSIILFSGGVDSTTLLAVLRKKSSDIICLTFDYGQVYTAEIEAAKRITSKYNIYEHYIEFLPSKCFSNYNLIKNTKVINQKSRFSGNLLPESYVPFRNMIFLTYASAFAEVHGINNIFIAINHNDSLNYPDCTAKFITSFEKAANLGSSFSLKNTKPLKIHAPFILNQKHEIIKIGIELGVDYSLTHTCLVPDKFGNPCGICNSCTLRRKSFNLLEVNDPLDDKYIDSLL